MRVKIAVWLLSLYLNQIASGQNLYWSQQYGGQATLMGGTAVVGVNDNTCIFYNPAAAELVDSSNVTVSTSVFGFEYQKLKNGAGTGLNLQSLNLDILPQVVSISIPVRKAPKLKLILGSLMRYNTNESFGQETAGAAKVITGSSAPQYYNAQVHFNNNSLEQWFGLSAAYKINETFPVGLTSFATYTHLDLGIAEDLTVDAFSSGLPYTAAVNVNNSMSLNQINEVFKLGATARFKNVHLGLTLTMPGIKVLGIGSLSKSFEVYNLNQNAVDTTMPEQKHSSYIVTDVQNTVQGYYKQPFSASFGFELIYTKFKISASLEFFTGYKNKTILRGVDNAYVRPTAFYGNDTIKGFMILQTSAIPVLNAGVGAEIKLQPTVNLLMGIRTDFNNLANYLPNDAALNVTGLMPPEWHYLYLSGGVSYKLALHYVTLGFDYGVGIPASRQQVFNITEPEQQLFLAGNLRQSMKTHVDKLNLIVSWTYFFKPNVKKYGPIPFFDITPKKIASQSEKSVLY